MSNHEAMTPAGKSSVSDQRDLVAEAASHDGAGRTQHLAHAGAAARSLVAYDDDVARLHLAGEDRLCGALFTVENSRAASEPQAFLAGDFRHRPFGREVAVHHDEMAVLLDRLRQRTNDVLALRIVGDVAQIFRERTA